MSRENFPAKPKISAARSDFPEVGKIYFGKLISVKRLGCFVRLNGFDGKARGFLFATDIGDRTLTDLRPTMNVFVKVLSISERNFLFLTMEAVDQATGQDLENSKGIERESLDPETIQIEMAALPNFFGRMVEKSGGKVPPGIQEQEDLDVMLYCLEAVNEEMKLTDFGKRIANYPVVPPLWRILMAGLEFRCSHEVLTIVSMIAADCDLFQISQMAKTKADIDRIIGRFFHPHGDYLTFLVAFEAFEENGGSPRWCSDNLVHFESLQRAKRWREKILETMNRMSLRIVRAGKDSPMIRKAIAAGMFSQSAKWGPRKNCNRTIANENRMVHVHSRSVLYYKQRPRFVVYGFICMDNGRKDWIAELTAIQPEWLPELAPLLFTVAGAARSRLEIEGSLSRAQPI